MPPSLGSCAEHVQSGRRRNLKGVSPGRLLSSAMIAFLLTGSLIPFASAEDDVTKGIRHDNRELDNGVDHDAGEVDKGVKNDASEVDKGVKHDNDERHKADKHLDKEAKKHL